MTNATRRTIVAGLAATPLAGLPALASAGPASDPVLAALARHDRARAALDAAYARTRAALDMGDDAALEAAEVAEDAPLDALNEAETAIVAANPTTRAGAAAQLRFIADHFEELIDDSRERAPDALRAVADLLAAEPAA
jgi:hypothetical protein